MSDYTINNAQSALNELFAELKYARKEMSGLRRDLAEKQGQLSALATRLHAAETAAKPPKPEDPPNPADLPIERVLARLKQYPVWISADWLAAELNTVQHARNVSVDDVKISLSVLENRYAADARGVVYYRDDKLERDCRYYRVKQ